MEYTDLATQKECLAQLGDTNDMHNVEDLINRGLDQYSALYADPKKWLQNGWLDYLAPQVKAPLCLDILFKSIHCNFSKLQLYWRIDSAFQPYRTLLDWWVEINSRNRHVVAGMNDNNLDARDWPADEIGNQIAISREEQYKNRGIINCLQCE